MSGDPYIKENDELRDEITDLQSANQLLQNLIGNRDTEIARLRSDLAVEKINNKRLQSERNNAEAEIERLQELLRGTGANRYWEGRWRDARAALEEILRLHDHRDLTDEEKLAVIAHEVHKALAKERE